MPTKVFPVEHTPRIVITNCSGDLDVQRWDERAIEVTADTDEQVGRMEQNDDALIIERATDDVRVRAPADAQVLVERLHGDLEARGIQSISVTDAHGDVSIAEVAEARLHAVGGDVRVRGVEHMILQDDKQREYQVDDLSAQRVSAAEIESVGGDLQLREVQTATIGSVGGDCDAQVQETLNFSSIGGDLQIRGGGQVQVRGGDIGGDFDARDLHDLMVGSVGGGAEIRAVTGDVRLGSVGGDATIVDAQGDIHLGPVGGDAELRTARGSVRAGLVGGDLHLQSAFPTDGTAGLQVGGDATIELPAEPNLTIQALVGGDVRGPGLQAGSGAVTVTYGEGSARLHLTVGGDLELRGAMPQQVSSSQQDWDTFGKEMSRVGDELGRNMERWGDEFGRKMSRWGDEFGRNMAKKFEDMEVDVHRAERKMRVKFNDREWVMDRDRLERLKEQARQAAHEGVSGALEAVERALAGLGVPPAPSEPPRPSAPPRPPAPTNVSTPPEPPATGPTMRLGAETDAADAPAPQASNAVAPDVETERAAILQMIAEGRISPEEGDMLLDALG